MITKQNRGYVTNLYLTREVLSALIFLIGYWTEDRASVIRRVVLDSARALGWKYDPHEDVDAAWQNIKEKKS